MENRRSSSRAPAHPPKSLWIEIGSVLVFTASIFSLFAIITYSPADPSVFSNIQGITHNACGRVGASLSALSLQSFGLGAFLLPVALFLLAASIHKREGKFRFLGTVGGMAISVMSLTVFLTLQWKYWPYAGSLILTGGAFGAWFAQLLMRQFNSLGASLVSLGAFLVAIAVSTPVSVSREGARLLGWLGNFTTRCARVAGVLPGRLARIVVTYVAYASGIWLMRGAHAAGDRLQKAIEQGIAGARARKREKATGILEAPAGKPGAKVIEIGVAGAARNAKAARTEGDSDSEDDDVVEVEDEAVPGEPAGESRRSVQRAVAKAVTASGAKASGSSFDGGHEVPNALPELEKNAAPRPAPKSAGFPEIMPPLAASDVHGASDADPAAPAEPLPLSDSLAPAAQAAKVPRVAKPKRSGPWKVPTAEFLRKPPKVESQVDRARLIANSQILAQKFADFGIDGEVTAVRPGPVITLYEFKPGPGVKVSRIAALADDLTMALSAQSVRILAPLPGKSVVGIEIPSDVRETVYMREFIQHPDFFGPKHAIPVVMGKDIGGQTYLSDLARMPHLLCAGQTGSGKSVFMNGLICSLLYRFTPDEMRMILVDPKFIEFRAYQDIPHLLLPVVDDPKHAAIALRWAVREMERRYRILAKIGARNLASFNQKVDEMGGDVVRDLLLSEENQDGGSSASVAGSDWIEAFEPDDAGAPRIGKLPYIVVIIDELADLMMIAKKEVEISIARIAQKARAAGIHLVIATQRPSTDVITGLIKANLPSRVSFQLASYIDSKTILDRSGAERLLGQGDMLFIPPGVSQNLRLHGAYMDDEEIAKITAFLKSQGKPAYRDEILLSEEEDEDGEGEGDGDNQDDDLFRDAVEFVKRSGHASASSLQRNFKVGYNRAARMIETMEARGIVGPADGARPREVLMR